MSTLTSMILHNITVFSDIAFRFSPGINIFIGKNGTGKTHILKILYAGCSITGDNQTKSFSSKLSTVFNCVKDGCEPLRRIKIPGSHLAAIILSGNQNPLMPFALASGDEINEVATLKDSLQSLSKDDIEKMIGPFIKSGNGSDIDKIKSLPDKIKTIIDNVYSPEQDINNNTGEFLYNNAKIVDNYPLLFFLNLLQRAANGDPESKNLFNRLQQDAEHILQSVVVYALGLENWKKNRIESVFIPVKEMLAHASGFISTVKRREMSFEETYEDIISAALLPPLTDPPFADLLKELQEVFDGEVVNKGERFFLETNNRAIDFSLVAEGWRKIALLWLLIRNGSIAQGSVLFWDEPETNLNPKLLQVVVKVLLELQRQGVQIFLSTHNYVLLKEFDLQSGQDDRIRYFSLYFGSEEEGVLCSVADEYNQIENNEIAHAFDNLYDREVNRSLGK